MCISRKSLSIKEAVVKFLARNSEAEAFLKTKKIDTAHELPPTGHSKMILVVDRYDFDSLRYERYRELGTYLIVIDDLADREIICDAYLNHNLFAHKLDLSSISADTFFFRPRLFFSFRRIKKYG